jgi:YD repeat-containing protein
MIGDCFSKKKFSARIICAGLFVSVLPLLASQPAAAQTNCSGIGIAPDSGNAVVLSLDGHISCLAADGATTSLNGRLDAAPSFGAPVSGAYAYDAENRLVTETGPGGTGTTTLDYAGSKLTSASDPLGNTIRYTYDAASNVVSSADSSDPPGKTTTYAYDAADRVATVADPSGNVTRYEYDAGGRIDETTDTAGLTTHYQYDPQNQLMEVMDSQGRTTTYTYDAQGQVTEQDDSLGGITSFTYDAAGNVLSDTDPLGHITTYTYDADQRLISDMESGATQFVYTSGVPEPATWAMLLLGFLGIGAVVRGSRRKDAVA